MNTFNNKWVNIKNEKIINDNALSNLQRASLMKLNSTLAEIESILMHETISLCNSTENRIKKSSDWPSDCQIDFNITFYLKEHDPLYDDNSENIIAELWEKTACNQRRRRWGISDGKNHNEFKNHTHPMKKEHHCWLYFSLYEISGIEWNHMLKIGSVCVDVTTTYQKKFKLG